MHRANHDHTSNISVQDPKAAKQKAQTISNLCVNEEERKKNGCALQNQFVNSSRKHIHISQI